MSRFDSHDIHPPPGLLINRSAMDCDIRRLYSSSTPVNHSAASLDRQNSQLYTTDISHGNSTLSPAYGIHDKDYMGLSPVVDGWTVAVNRNAGTLTSPQIQHVFSPNHSRPSPSLITGPSPPSHTPSPAYYSHSSEAERDSSLPRSHIQPAPSIPQSSTASSIGNASFRTDLPRSTLWWGGLEPWMDEEYAKQVCSLMGWNPVNVKVPSSSEDPSGQQANNPGYCFLAFASPAIAASALDQVNGVGGSKPVLMPNSNKPFVLNWASSVLGSLMPPTLTSSSLVSPGPQQQYQKEYSIFVGDLAPETSNSDLVAVFRNPLLGLRNDREPKFIRPFLSCKSAKIMLDPVTGVSRGYGFVRFTDEADQQRALVEMHGLYCLSRPMRISPATAKYKPPQPQIPLNLPTVPYPLLPQAGEQRSNPTASVPPSSANRARSVSSPIAASICSGSSSSTSTPVVVTSPGTVLKDSASVPPTGTMSSNGVSSGVLSPPSSEDVLGISSPTAALYGTVSLKGHAATGTSLLPSSYPHGSHEQNSLPRYNFSEESWKHHAQARAILGNLIGPNGEQLTSTDPYNTTVFVGGLSPLISEDTLRTFFAPFGDIHYVKVPAGKHCGFVQFVRKADAERAIEKMQGFPIGGSRIRLSWGRSQYKAAQAAAQAAQTAALQAQLQAQMPANLTTPLSSEQALQLLHKLGISSFGGQTGANGQDMGNTGHVGSKGANGSVEEKPFCTNQVRPDGMISTPFHDAFSNSYVPHSMATDALDYQRHMQPHFSSSFSTFSPFSPDPGVLLLENRGNQSKELSALDAIAHVEHVRGFDSMAPDSDKVAEFLRGSIRMPNSSQKLGTYFERSPPRQEPISRPNSGQTSSQGHSSQCDPKEEHEPIHDLNGTLASLNLDHSNPWKTSKEGSDMQVRGS
ncbi:hypothetical protein BKA82DRAFT_992351 [Pisolithus tinctorius]|uniref:RRM domain-containing protein n=1 Tax=Pisolithus tinctorius Marx 270 TaxID=870435 RepID=A0A0C3PIZ4_PISTI|nr:hypothetical protein BKA82DRAFT_992351 [Pisolithus tinctorius]KIO14105.1 hypothetical protein M404DRAFT_992351 [Pisolithus tinctorius Marx 270]